MAFFERADIRALSERLLALEEGQGIPLTSRAGQELHAMLSAVDGIRPVGRGAARQLTERGRLFLISRLKETSGEPAWSGELALPERALDRLRGVEWQGRQIVTVENKGAFVDYPLQPDELLLYVPGRNTTLAKQVIPLLPAATPWAHFGDLDQRGLDIAAELANAMARPLALRLPEHLMEYVQHYARGLRRPSDGQQSRRGKIPWRDHLGTAQENDVLARALAQLVASKTWLEQEVMVTARLWRSWPLGDLPE